MKTANRMANTDLDQTANTTAPTMQSAPRTIPAVRSAMLGRCMPQPRRMLKQGMYLRYRPRSQRRPQRHNLPRPLAQ